MSGTLFGLDASLVQTLADSVAPGEDGADVFARAMLTGIAEPGDRAAGILVAALGAPSLLTALLERWTAPRIVDAVLDRAASGASGAFAMDGVGLDDGDLTKALERWQPRVESDVAVRTLRQAARVGAVLLVPDGDLWPTGLDDLGDHAPLALWVRGVPDALSALDRSIALVGARAATGYGEHVAIEAAAGLVDRGFAIVSGAAYGIDGMAHRSALASRGLTVAFLAGGVDRFYPSGHDALLARMVEVGAVVSELPCGSAPTKWRFLQRNRLIAAVSQATIVLEAGWRSGSLNTAGHAASLGRPLGAVPGPVTSPASAGCHRLIRDYDAVCVTNADEMAELVAGASGTSMPRTSPGSATHPAAGDAGTRAADERGGSAGNRSDGGRTVGGVEDGRVLDALSARSPRSELDIARRSGLSVSSVQSCLGRLELDGFAAEKPTGWLRKGP